MDAHFAAAIIFYAALISIVFLPLGSVMISYVIMCNLDVPGLGNTIKILIVPLILLLRFHIYRKQNRLEPNEINIIANPSLTYGTWILFACYSFLAIFWSETGNYVAGLKFVLQLVGIFLFYITFKQANQLQLLNRGFVTSSVFATLALGVLQTYVVESSFGVELSRFTGFVASQQYAAFLVGLLAVTLWNYQPRWGGMKFVLSCLLLTALFANGSRTWFLGAVIVFAFWLIHRTLKNLAYAALVHMMTGMAILGSFMLYQYSMANENQWRDANRLLDTYYSIVEGEDVASEGTFGARKIMNEGMLAEIREGTTMQLLFGHGTSASEKVAKKYHSYMYRNGVEDPNRVAHNEWLRIVYEFGIVGITLWLTFLMLCLLRLVKQKVKMLPLLSYAIGLLFALTTENILMGAGNVVLCGLMILLACKQTRTVPILTNVLSKNDKTAPSIISLGYRSEVPS
ncbi:O-antigen ligase family protein [Paenibacillus medicaginis]|uniref:O-antigen ligase family protein n=1 Tax=Paenibacillus medicaginis TaxID=1470560 RepID=A0ABV5BY98_9BACL